MLAGLKSQWQAECSKIGAFFKKVLSSVFIVSALAAHAIEQASLLPDGFIPQGVKYGLGVLAALSFLLGGLTKKAA